MAKVLVIPDTHSRDFWKEAKNIINNYEYVVFLGDYVDPYPEEFKLTHKQLREKTLSDFKEIIAFAKQHQSKVILLDGNHLLHYVNPNYKCTRFDHNLHHSIAQLYNDNNKLFNRCYVIDDVLFTHAGVTLEWCDSQEDPKDIINKSSFKKLMSCSSFRGGLDNYSGPEWLDVREIEYLTLPEKYFQVFGHTLCEYPIINEKFACIDTKQLYELDTLTHEIKPL